MAKEQDRVYTFKISSKLLGELKQLAILEGRSVSRLIRTAIERFVMEAKK